MTSSKILEYRLRRGISQADLARLLGVSQNNISKYELGRHMPGVPMAIQIERVLGPEVPAEALNPVLAEFLDLYHSRKT